MSRPTLSELLETTVRMEALLTAAGLTTLDARQRTETQTEIALTVAGAEAERDQALAVLALPPASACLSSISVYPGTRNRTVSSSIEAADLRVDWLTVSARRPATDDELAEAAQ